MERRKDKCGYVLWMATNFFFPVSCQLMVDHGGLPVDPAEMDCQGSLDMSIQR